MARSDGLDRCGGERRVSHRGPVLRTALLHRTLELPSPGGADVRGDLGVSVRELHRDARHLQVQAAPTAAQLYHRQPVSGGLPRVSERRNHQFHHQLPRIFLLGEMGLCSGGIRSHLFW